MIAPPYPPMTEDRPFADRLADAAELDTGTLAERLAEAAHAAAYTTSVTASGYRELAALALEMARRSVDRDDPQQDHDHD